MNAAAVRRRALPPGLEHTVNGVTVMQWPNGILFAVGLMVVFFILNYFGVKLLSEVNRWVTLWKLVIPTLTAIFLFTVGHGSNYHSYHGFIPKIFQRANRFGIPWAAALLAGVIGILVMYPAPSWYELVGIITGMTSCTRPSSSACPCSSGTTPPRNGWFPTATARMLAAATGVVFLAAWVYIQDMGGIVLRVVPSSAGVAAPGSWGFPVYFAAQAADVLFFCAALWALAGAKGRRDVMSGLWVIVMLLALLPVDCYGKFGPEAKPAIGFPYETLIAIGIGLVCYAWAVLVGYNTEALRDITSQAEGDKVTAGSV